MVLTAKEIQALRWVSDGCRMTPQADMFSHGAAMQSLRDRGLIRRYRRPYGHENLLTAAGRKAVKALPFPDRAAQ